MLICKVYVSSAPRVQDQLSLGEILVQARGNNARDGITGVLCVFDSNFIQVLEGEEAAVNRTFAKIQMDPRHRNILELYNEPIGDRIYGEWTMALTSEEKLDPAQRALCRDLRTAAIDAGAGGSHRQAVTALLEAFKISLR